ncbi:MAG: BamA/TamA family outer membrane protein [Lutibacter sp.]|nr:BamA/TamA family outer membrane protein [Lutibacter sp.]
MKNNFAIILIALGIVYCFSSCNAVKYVPENEHLLIKNKVYVNGKKDMDNEINDYIVQRPNQRVFTLLPFPLHFYNLGNRNFESNFEKWAEEHPIWYRFTNAVFSEKQTRGLRKFKYQTHQWFLKNGEAPVVIAPEKTLQTVQNLSQYFYNNGYFRVRVSPEIVPLSSKKAEVSYKVETGQAFTIDTLSTAIQSPILDSIYKTHEMESALKKGRRFKLATFIEEQNRISDLFRNSGVYRFNKNAIGFDVDTTQHAERAKVTLIISDSIAKVPYRVQKIKTVRIYPDHTFRDKQAAIKDSVTYDDYTFLGRSSLKYHPKRLLNSVFIKPGNLYRDLDRERTIGHLRNLQNFKSVDVKYTELDNDMLEASIYLSPLKKYAAGLSTELTRSNIRRLGILGKVSVSNRNVFRGAEILNFSVQGSFLDSKNATNRDQLLNAWELGADLSLVLPRFLLPSGANKIIPKQMVPKTTISLGGAFQKNIGLDKQRFTGIIDYTWESNKEKKHSLQLLNAQYIRNLNPGSYFDIYQTEYDSIKKIADTYFNQDIGPDQVIPFINDHITTSFNDTNPAVYAQAQNIKKRRDIITEDVLIPSMAYTFTFNNSEDYKDLDFSYFRIRLVSSGSLTSLLSQQENGDQTKTLFTIPIAQYVKTDLEYKKFWDLSFENVLAFRSFLGMAFPFHNSTSIPFSRSYFIGGPNDLRAWRIYDLGPGASQTGLEYNVGSLKFISSLEYRFKILNSLKGALFVDAGNIWDITGSDLISEEAKFKGLHSLKDIAVGTGIGIRYDLNFILLRLDLGLKTYEPYLKDSQKWFQHYDLRNAVYNFGISYPF